MVYFANINSIYSCLKLANLREYVYPVLTGVLVIADDEVSFYSLKNSAVPFDEFLAFNSTVWPYFGVVINIERVTSDFDLNLLFHYFQSIQKLL